MEKVSPAGVMSVSYFIERFLIPAETKRPEKQRKNISDLKIMKAKAKAIYAMPLFYVL